VDDIQEIITALRNKGIGVLISDHNVRETLRICDRAYLVHDGQDHPERQPGGNRRQSRARKVYLGEGFSL
jgi:lipopolysaccharide export system ATP-binding protein